MVVQAVMIHVLWGKDLKASHDAEARVMAMNPAESIKDWLLLKQSLAVLTLVMIAFVLARPLHLEPATIALFGAAVLMLLDNWAHHAEKAAHNIHSHLRRRGVDHHLLLHRPVHRGARRRRRRPADAARRRSS